MEEECEKNSGKYDYLVCSGCNNGYCDCNNKDAIRYDILEKIVLDKINGMIKKNYDYKLLKKEENNDIDNDLDIKIGKLENRKRELEDKIENSEYYLRCLYEDKAKGVISLCHFETLIKNYCNENNDTLMKVNTLEKEIDFYKKNNVKKWDLTEYKKFEKLDRYIILEYISKIYIGNLNRDLGIRDIKIEWII